MLRLRSLYETGSRHSEDLVRKKLREYLGPLPQLEHVAQVIREDLPDPNEDPHAFDRILMSSVNEPCLIDLIWSYWLEQGMLVQTMNEVTRRFQNIRGPADRDPLFHLNTDPLRPLDNILWAFIQDEPHCLSVKRRAHEYTHQYGLSLSGQAISHEGQIDGHSDFIAAFHNLLRLAMTFFKEDDNTTVINDEYPLLKTIREVHLMLAPGAHNQFGDLPWTARAEMLQQQWILARPEVRGFLNSRETVSYEEAWMPQVDIMKTLQGWSGAQSPTSTTSRFTASKLCCRCAMAVGRLPTIRITPGIGHATGDRRFRAMCMLPALSTEST